MTKEVICPVCEGHGFSVVLSEYSISSHACDNCNGSGLIEVPMTNADRIRAMSDEELAEILGEYMHCAGCPLRGDCNPEELPCENVLLEWLKQPVEVEDGQA